MLVRGSGRHRKPRQGNGQEGGMQPQSGAGRSLAGLRGDHDNEETEMMREQTCFNTRAPSFLSEHLTAFRVETATFFIMIFFFFLLGRK